MSTKRIDFNKARDFGQIVNATFEFLRYNIKPLGKAVLFVPGPFLLLSGVFTGLYQRSAFTIGFSPINPFGFSGAILLSTIFIVISMVLLTTLVYNYILIYNENETPDLEVENIWRKSSKDIFRVLGFIITLSLMILLMLIPFFIVMLSGNFFISFLVFFLMMIPIVYVTTSASLIFVTGIAERKGFIESLKRSFRLINNKWWITFGLIFVFGLTQGFISFIFQMPLTIVTIIIGVTSADGSHTGLLSELIIIILSVFSSFSYLLYAISLVGLSFHYYSLIEQKEAKSLLERIENL